MNSDAQSPSGQIDSTFRNGTITAVSVLGGFSLTFLTGWAAEPGKWELFDGLAFLILLAGLAFQMRALIALLKPDSLEIPRYYRAVRWFLTGVALVALGAAVTVVIEIVHPTAGRASHFSAIAADPPPTGGA